MQPVIAALLIVLIVLAVVMAFRPAAAIKESFEEEEGEAEAEAEIESVKTLAKWLEEVAPNFFEGYLSTIRQISQIYDKIIATWAETMAEGRSSAQYIPEVKIQIVEEAKMSFPDYNTDLLEAMRLYKSGRDYKESAQKFAGLAVFKYTPDKLKAQLVYFEKKLFAMAKKIQSATNDSSDAASRMASAPPGIRSECKAEAQAQGFINYPELPPPSEDVLRAPFLAFRQVFNNDTMSTLNTLVDTCSRLVRRLDGISDDAEGGQVQPPPASC
jgi:hypothetical protein